MVPIVSYTIYHIPFGPPAAPVDALFRAAWVEGLDVNDAAVVGRAAAAVGLDPERHLAAAMGPGPGDMLQAAQSAFDRDECPGVPVWVVGGERFWGEDRVDWVVARARELAGGARA